MKHRHSQQFQYKKMQKRRQTPATDTHYNRTSQNVIIKQSISNSNNEKYNRHDTHQRDICNQSKHICE